MTKKELGNLCLPLVAKILEYFGSKSLIILHFMMTGTKDIQNGPNPKNSSNHPDSTSISTIGLRCVCVCACCALLPRTSPEIVARLSIPSQSFSASSFFFCLEEEVETKKLVKKPRENTQKKHNVYIYIYIYKVPSEQRSCSMIFVDLHLILSWMVDVTRSTCFRVSGRHSEYNFVNRYIMYM